MAIVAFSQRRLALPPSYLRNVSLAVESLAVATLVTANFLASADFAGSTALVLRFLSLAPSAFDFAAAGPISDFLLITICVYRS
jgi:hypothetical protein